MNTPNTMIVCSSEPLWNSRTSCETVSESSRSRRCSTETIFSIQDRETDLLRDSSDTEWCESDEERAVEFEPVTEPEEDAPLNGDSSGNSDNEIISTKVIEVLVGDDGDLEFADSEQTASEGSDSEMDFYDYWNCAQCRSENNNPLYRYCEKCYKVRKNFFPPRPKRKHKLEPIPRTLSQDSGVESANSQELVATDQVDGPSQPDTNNRLSEVNKKKRRSESADRNERNVKRARNDDTDTDSETNQEIKPLVKTVSDPAVTVDDRSNHSDPKKDENMCIVCYNEPKSGVFVHGRIAHICCCYKCARQVWAKAKRCPVCNCKVSNVLRAVVM